MLIYLMTYECQKDSVSKCELVITTHMLHTCNSTGKIRNAYKNMIN